MSSVHPGVKKLVHVNGRVRAGERVVIVTDYTMTDIAKLVAVEARAVGAVLERKAWRDDAPHQASHPLVSALASLDSSASHLQQHAQERQRPEALEPRPAPRTTECRQTSAHTAPHRWTSEPDTPVP